MTYRRDLKKVEAALALAQAPSSLATVVAQASAAAAEADAPDGAATSTPTGGGAVSWPEVVARREVITYVLLAQVQRVDESRLATTTPAQGPDAADARHDGVAGFQLG